MTTTVRVVYVNDERTLFVEAYADTDYEAGAMPDVVYVAERQNTAETWGPPVTLKRDMT